MCLCSVSPNGNISRTEVHCHSQHTDTESSTPSLLRLPWFYLYPGCVCVHVCVCMCVYALSPMKFYHGEVFTCPYHSIRPIAPPPGSHLIYSSVSTAAFFQGLSIRPVTPATNRLLPPFLSLQGCYINGLAVTLWDRLLSLTIISWGATICCDT